MADRRGFDVEMIAISFFVAGVKVFRRGGQINRITQSSSDGDIKERHRRASAVPVSVQESEKEDVLRILEEIGNFLWGIQPFARLFGADGIVTHLQVVD